MNEHEKTVETNTGYKWWAWIATILLVLSLLGYCTRVSERLIDYKNRGKNTIEQGYENSKENFQDRHDANRDLGGKNKISNYYTKLPSNKYYIRIDESLYGLSKRWHVSVPDIVAKNPDLANQSPSKPIDHGEVVNVPDGTNIQGFEAEVVRLTNDARKAQGLAPLKANNGQLNKSAHAKSQAMSDSGQFSHTTSKYGDPFQQMKSFGISYSYAAENIATGQKTPKEVVDAWLNSSGHRQNIMNPNLDTIGVGYVHDKGHDAYWTQQFIGN